MRARITLAAAALAVLIGGCGGASSTGPSAERYLRALATEQRKLAAAERRIPRRPRTPAALARSIDLLRGAIARLAADLARIAPPRSVANLHQQLVAIARSYGARLASVERTARQRQRAGRAASLLVSATREASASFAATVERIQGQLKKS
jgi:hypothetical protein